VWTDVAIAFFIDSGIFLSTIKLIKLHLHSVSRGVSRV
jgi:hypothetical protein